MNESTFVGNFASERFKSFFSFVKQKTIALLKYKVTLSASHIQKMLLWNGKDSNTFSDQSRTFENCVLS